MAEIQDEIEEQGELETVENQIQQETQEQSKPELPEKYRGKTLEDIVKMHQEAEKMVGRQAQEVGEVRRLADELLRSQLSKPVEKEKPKEIDFFENPQEAIRQAIDNSPKVQAAEQYAVQAQRQQALQTLANKHADYQQVVKEDEFNNWIKSSQIRTQLFQQADNYDFNAADELISTYKQLKAVKQQQTTQAVSEVEKKARDKTMQAASVDTGGSGESSRKVYSRATLLYKRIHDPAWIEAHQDEISQAYREGRVR